MSTQPALSDLQARLVASVAIFKAPSVPSQHSFCRVKVKWQCNDIGGIRTGTDDAYSIGEAFAIAETRVRHAGIPSYAWVYFADADNTDIRTYGKDFDGKVSYTESRKVPA